MRHFLDYPIYGLLKCHSSRRTSYVTRPMLMLMLPTRVFNGIRGTGSILSVQSQLPIYGAVKFKQFYILINGVTLEISRCPDKLFFIRIIRIVTRYTTWKNLAKHTYIHSLHFIGQSPWNSISKDLFC